MAKSLRAFALAVLVITTVVAAAGGTAVGADRWIGEESEEDEGAGPGPAGSDDWFATQRVFPFRSLDIGALETRAAAQAAAVSAGPSIQAAWQPLGPANIGGRVTDLVASPTQANTVFAGAATGGVWKSTDGGVTFGSA